MYMECTMLMTRAHVQVYRRQQRSFWKADKAWCKGLMGAELAKALQGYTANEGAANPSSVYGGPQGVIAQLENLRGWFEVQTLHLTGT